MECKGMQISSLNEVNVGFVLAMQKVLNHENRATLMTFFSSFVILIFFMSKNID